MARTQSVSPTPDDIRAARDSVGLNQTEAAALIDHSRNSWAKYEGGARAMPAILWQVWRIRAGLDKPAAIFKR